MSDDNKEGAGVLSDAEFEKWLRTVCFQKPTPEAYDLARSAYRHAAALSAAVMPAAPSDAWMRERADELVQKIHARIGTWGEQRKAIADFALEVATLSQTMQPQAEPAAGQEQAGAVSARAWINYPVKVVNGEFAGYGEPELSFKRLSYGYDCDKAEALYLAAPGAAIAAREQGETSGPKLSKKDLNKLLNDFARACTAYSDEPLARMAATKAIHEYLDAAFAALKGMQPGERKEGAE